jgi:Tfp pilus assembly protein PilV
MKVTSDKWRVASGASRLSALPRSPSSAFTLLEVMIAIAIFFMCVFSILQLVSTNLKHVQRLQRPSVDIGSLASELSLTNRLEEGGESGNFGSLYPGVSWSRAITMVGTNGLYQVDFTVTDSTVSGRAGAQSSLSIFLYRPDSVMGGAGGLRR